MNSKTLNCFNSTQTLIVNTFRLCKDLFLFRMIFRVTLIRLAAHNLIPFSLDSGPHKLYLVSNDKRNVWLIVMSRIVLCNAVIYFFNHLFKASKRSSWNLDSCQIAKISHFHLWTLLSWKLIHQPKMMTKRRRYLFIILHWATVSQVTTRVIYIHNWINHKTFSM